MNLPSSMCHMHIYAARALIAQHRAIKGLVSRNESLWILKTAKFRLERAKTWALIGGITAN